MWNYRIIKKKGDNPAEDSYGLYEVFYNDAGDVSAHAQNPDITGASVKEIKKTLKLMSRDVKKCKGKVLKWGKIKFNNW